MRLIWYSVGSRTSRMKGRVPASMRALSSSTLMSLIASAELAAGACEGATPQNCS